MPFDEKDVIEVDNQEFTVKRVLGEGQYGEVSACEYTGQELQIKELADANSIVAVKVFKRFEDPTEFGNIQHLNQIQLLNPTPTANFVKQLVAKDEANHYKVISERLTFNGEDSAHITKFETDRKLLFFCGTLFTDECLTYMLARFSSGIVYGQNELHNAGMLHLDSSTDNYMVTKVTHVDGSTDLSCNLIDLGLSQIIDPNHIKELEYNPRLMQLRPGKYDQDTIASYNPNFAPSTSKIKFTIHTDLFLRRLTILEMLANAIGSDIEEVLCLKDIQLTDLDPHFVLSKPLPARELYLAKRVRMDDTFALTHYVSNVAEHAIDLLEARDDDNRARVALHFLNVFYDYLTNMPSKDATYEEIIASDLARFEEAHQTFLNALPPRLNNDAYVATLIRGTKPVLTCDEELETEVWTVTPNIDSQQQLKQWGYDEVMESDTYEMTFDGKENLAFDTNMQIAPDESTQKAGYIASPAGSPIKVPKTMSPGKSPKQAPDLVSQAASQQEMDISLYDFSSIKMTSPFSSPQSKISSSPRATNSHTPTTSPNSKAPSPTKKHTSPKYSSAQTLAGIGKFSHPNSEVHNNGKEEANHHQRDYTRIARTLFKAPQ